MRCLAEAVTPFRRATAALNGSLVLERKFANESPAVPLQQDRVPLANAKESEAKRNWAYVSLRKPIDNLAYKW